MAQAASRYTLFGKRVARASELDYALQASVDVVEEDQRAALLEVIVSWKRSA